MLAGCRLAGIALLRLFVQIAAPVSCPCKVCRVCRVCSAASATGLPRQSPRPAESQRAPYAWEAHEKRERSMRDMRGMQGLRGASARNEQHALLHSHQATTNAGYVRSAGSATFFTPYFGQPMTTEGTRGRRAGLPRECAGVQSVLRSKPSIPYIAPFNSGMTNMPGMPGILCGLPRC